MASVKKAIAASGPKPKAELPHAELGSPEPLEAQSKDSAPAARKVSSSAKAPLAKSGAQRAGSPMREARSMPAVTGVHAGDPVVPTGNEAEPGMSLSSASKAVEAPAQKKPGRAPREALDSVSRSSGSAGARASAKRSAVVAKEPPGGAQAEAPPSRASTCRPDELGIPTPSFSPAPPAEPEIVATRHETTHETSDGKPAVADGAIAEPFEQATKADDRTTVTQQQSIEKKAAVHSASARPQATGKLVDAKDSTVASQGASQASGKGAKTSAKSKVRETQSTSEVLSAPGPLAAGTHAADEGLAPAKPAAEPRPEKLAVPAATRTKIASSPRQGFKASEFIVYPAHGVGQIVAIEEQEVAGFKLELFVISFEKDKMTLKVPTSKAASVGMRKLAEADVVKKAFNTLSGRARIKRTMWSRRAQEYEAKINSGDLVAIAEVVRDLFRSESQPEQSYSERQLYEAALDRMAREIVVVQKMTETESLKAIEAQLHKGPRRGKVDEVDSDETDIEEAA